MTAIDTDGLIQPAFVRRNQSTSAWTTELESEITDLWKSHSASEIVIQLNARGYTFTRNAVMGKLHRIGLTLEAKTHVHPLTRAAVPRQRRASTGPKPPKAQPYLFQEFPKVEVRHLSIGEVEGCRFECSGTDNVETFTFCGRALVPGKPYCAEHCAICYLPPTPNRRRQ